MRKNFILLSLITAFILLSLDSKAQKSAINKAENFMETGDLEKALENIEAAITHDKTKDDPRAWYVRSRVYLAVLATAESKEDTQTLIGDKDPISEILKSKKMVEKYDKADGPYIGKMSITIEGVHLSVEDELKALLAQKGLALQESNPKGAYEAFADLVRVFPEDTLLIRNAIALAERAEMTDATIKHIEQLVSTEGYNNIEPYMWWIGALAREERTEEVQTVVEKALVKFPHNEMLLAQSVNHYIGKEDYKKVIEILEKLVQINPEKMDYWQNLALLYEQEEQSEKTIATLEKMMKIDPNSYQANLGLGTYYYNQAVKLGEKLEEEGVKGQPKELIEAFKKAAPYLEKAIEINNEEVRPLGILQSIYNYVDDEKNLKRIKAKIAELN
ncbi:MAG: hypothetical protein JJT94_08455 [Bernardetiaceae bacterium]|nr:hypothetical protein [Bernardetiaceae bacterium]